MVGYRIADELKLFIEQQIRIYNINEFNQLNDNKYVRM